MTDFLIAASKFRKRILIVVLFTVLIIVILVAVIASKQDRAAVCDDPESSAKSLFVDFFEWKLLQYPEGATLARIHKYDEILDDISEANFEKKNEDVIDFLKRSEALRPCLEGSSLLSLKILTSQLKLFKDGFKYKGYLFPDNNLSNLQSNLQKVFNKMPRKESRDYDVMLSRMEKIPTKVDQTIGLFRRGMQQNKQFHRVSLKGLVGVLSQLVTPNAEDSYFYTLFSGSYPSSVTSQEIESFQQKAKEIITNKITPAFQKYIDFLNKDYVTRQGIAITSEPGGDEMYKQLLRVHTSSNMTPTEIHEIGLREVKDIEGSMKEVISDLGYGAMSLSAFSNVIKRNAANYHNSTKNLLNGYRKLVKEAILKIPKYFNTVPKAKLQVIGDPSPTAQIAYYTNPSLDGSVPGILHVAIHNPKSSPKFYMPTLTLHEGSPGHHHQASILMESDLVPVFRKVNLGEGLNMLPSGFSYPVAYEEGWSQYAESLGFEMKMFNDPLDRYGYYASEMHRACTLVVDTGMHALNWAREKAIDYMLTYMILDRVVIESEVDRYITWPGQASGYKIGELKIIELRDKAIERLKGNFNIREFHDVVLSPPGPLNILEEEVNKWIDMEYKNSN